MSEKVCINHYAFFTCVLNGNIKLSNDQDADTFTSWKVGGQDFYAFGVRVVAGEAPMPEPMTDNARIVRPDFEATNRSEKRSERVDTGTRDE